MTTRDIFYYRLNFGVGQIIRIPKILSSERSVMVDAEIVGIYPHFVLVTDGNYRWSVNWIDLIKLL